MTLEEKVGQLGSYWHRPAASEDVTGDVAPLQHAMSAGLSWADSIRDGLGHLTRVFGTEPISVAEGVAALRRYQAEVVARSRFAIPAIAHEECLTGVTAFGATVYPAPLAWGAAFDPELIEEMASAIGSDLKALGVDQGLAPVLDVVRDYRWGRVEETIGEDPYLVGTVGTAYVRGLQAAGVAATLKHFAGYSASRAGRNHAPVSVGRRELEEVFFPPFEMAVREASAASVMNSYADLDGLPPAADRALLTGVLRDRWGFEGTVVADYWAITFLDLRHHVANGSAHAATLALHAGVDIELPNTIGYAELANEVRAGTIDEGLVDRAAERVLRQKIEMGLLDPAFEPQSIGRRIDLDSTRNRDIARTIAAQSVILLQNDGVLPLAAPKRVAVLGPIADQPSTFLGCYSFPNHVLAKYAGGRDLGIRVLSLVEALAEELGGDVELVHRRGVPIQGHDRSGLEDAVAAAAASDVAIVAVGDQPGMFGMGTSGEGCDAPDLRLPGLQQELVEAILETGTPTVLVVVSGRPYALGSLADRCRAVVQAFVPGQEAGAVIAGILCGRLNPEGKLPVGIPFGPGGQPGTYLAPPLAWQSDGISNLDPRPRFPFGFGASYTTFEVADLTLSTHAVAPDGTLEVSVSVRNVGTRAGAEVVQLYLSDETAQVARPIKQLVGYRKVRLEPGESRSLTFVVHADRMSFVGAEYERVVEPGRMQVLIGTSSEDLPLTDEFHIVGELRVVPEGRVMSTPVRVAPAGVARAAVG